MAEIHEMGQGQIPVGESNEVMTTQVQFEKNIREDTPNMMNYDSNCSST